MKKALALLLVLAMCICALAACGGGSSNQPANQPSGGQSSGGQSSGGESSGGQSSGGQSSGGQSSTPAQEYLDELIIAYASDTATADPFMDSSTQLLLVTNQTFRGMVKYDQATGELLPMLATSWSSNDDCTVWTFKLRDDVKFHDGTTFDADDVVFTFERCIDGEQVKVPASLIKASFQSIRAVDKYTVEITLQYPVVDYPYQAGVKIYSKEAFESGMENPGYIGCGPYYWAGQEIGVSYTLERFDDYFGEKAKTKTVTFRVMPEVDSQIAALQAGEINFCTAARATDIPMLKEDPNITIDEGSGATVYFLAMNGRREWTNNKKLTDAIAWGLDKDALNMAMWQGTSYEATNMVGNTANPGYVDVDPGYHYDLEKAKSLLAEAGYKPDELTLTLMYYAWCKPYAEATAACLNDMGIKTEMMEIDGSVYRAICMEGEYDITFTYCTLGASVNYMNDRFYTEDGGGNWFGYVPTKEIKDQFEVCKAQKTMDGLLKEAAKLQQLCSEDTRYIPLHLPVSRAVYTSNVKGYVRAPSNNGTDYSTVLVEKR